MAEPFKNVFNRRVVEDIARRLRHTWDHFDEVGFVAAATDGLENKELKERSDQIEGALQIFLPADFPHAAVILRNSLHPGEDAGPALVTTEDSIAGWPIVPISGFVGRHGVEHLPSALDLMKELTKRFSAEFGIRFLIMAQPERCLVVMRDWTCDPNRHVRRLVSEGTRPRLPWAPRLPVFIEDPSPLLPLLVALRDDPEEYVRRSVANNLNDIAKDHPDLVAGIANDWLAGAPVRRQRLVRHACRSLVKQGHLGALAALGYREAQVRARGLNVTTPQVVFGSSLEFELSLTSTSTMAQDLIIDYIVHHRKADGSLSPKVFKWKTVRLPGGRAIAARRRHPIRQITTRVYYPGQHKLEIQVNGALIASAGFELLMPERG